MKLKKFEKLVTDALESLPAYFKDKIENVAVVIEDKSAPKKDDDTNRYIILGLYEGVPLSDRTHLYGMVLPDKITIFKRNIEQACRTEEEIRELVTRTVLHELAHHFGISDRRLREMGAY